MPHNINEIELEKKIDEFFEQNYEMIRAEGNRPLTPDMRKKAKDQVKEYWRKLKHIATRITDTEVRLTLPEQKTPEGRRFAIEGIVDIVREEEETWMYDLKTQEKEMIEENIQDFINQLNVYTHIWQNLRENTVDKLAIISTSVPRDLQQATKDNNLAARSHYLKLWDPIIEVPFQQEGVNQMIQAFGEVVDHIENKEFDAPPLEKLEERFATTRGSFANKICRFCDARYSCTSYRAYASKKFTRGFDFRHYFEEDQDENVQEEYLEGNLPTSIQND